MSDSHVLINEKLTVLGEECGVRVLYAVEAGSRAWGFASPDSDYDVRFIYVRPRDDYLRLDNVDDVLEYEISELYDIVGWDIQKALRLFHKSNPSLFEWLGSPVIYKTTDVFERHRTDLLAHYQKKHGLYHYFNMAKRNFHANFKTDRVPLKRYLYVIRPLLACKWILNSDSPPPVLFGELVSHALEPELHSAMDDMLAKKSIPEESEKHVRVALWDQWINDNFAMLAHAPDALEPDSKMSWQKLNEVFLDIITNAY